MEGFQKLQKDGKIRAYGVSTSDSDYFKHFNHDGYFEKSSMERTRQQSPSWPFGFDPTRNLTVAEAFLEIVSRHLDLQRRPQQHS